MTDPFKLNRLITAQLGPELRKRDQRFGDGIVAVFAAGMASVRKGDPQADPTPGFYVSPEIELAEGDHVWYYDDGGFKLVILNLSRISTVERSGVWTPVLQCATNGNLAITYTEQTGWWRRNGDRVTYGARIQTSAFTWTTASGNWQVAGLPFTVETPDVESMCLLSGWTKASYSQIGAVAKTGTKTLELRATGSGQALAALVAADIPTGAAVILRSTGDYLTADP